MAVFLASPFCLQMLGEGIKKIHLQETIEALDIAELVQKTM